MITRQELIAINKEYRAKDDSHLWPICNKFNATERAIREARYFRGHANECETGYEYCLLLDLFITTIVNDERNW